MNFVVAKILGAMEDEEEAFWILCCLIEDILPIDYFSNMVGVLVDQKIFTEMVSFHNKELAAKFAKLDGDPSLICLQWFVCCYVTTLSDKLSDVIWDLLMVEGHIVLYKAGLVFLDSLKKFIMEVEEFHEIFDIIDQNIDVI